MGTIKHTTDIELTNIVNELLYSYKYISVSSLDMRVLKADIDPINNMDIIVVEVPLPKMYDNETMSDLTKMFYNEFSKKKYRDKNEFIKVKFIF